MSLHKKNFKNLIFLALIIVMVGFLFARVSLNSHEKNQLFRNHLAEVFTNSSITGIKEFDLDETDLLIMQGFTAFFPQAIEQLQGELIIQTGKSPASALALLILYAASQTTSLDERDACLTAFFTYFPQNFPDPEAFAASIHLINRNVRGWQQGFVDIACKSAAQKIASDIILPLMLADNNLTLDRFSRFFQLFPELRISIEEDLVPKIPEILSAPMIDDLKESSPADQIKESLDEC